MSGMSAQKPSVCIHGRCADGEVLAGIPKAQDSGWGYTDIPPSLVQPASMREPWQWETALKNSTEEEQCFVSLNWAYLKLQVNNLVLYSGEPWVFYFIPGNSSSQVSMRWHHNMKPPSIIQTLKSRRENFHLGFTICKIISCVNSDHLNSSFPIWLPCISLESSQSWGRCWDDFAQKPGEPGHPEVKCVPNFILSLGVEGNLGTSWVVTLLWATNFQAVSEWVVQMIQLYIYFCFREKIP